MSQEKLKMSVHLCRAGGFQAQNKDLGTRIIMKQLRSFLFMSGKKRFNSMTKTFFPTVPLLSFAGKDNLVFPSPVLLLTLQVLRENSPKQELLVLNPKIYSSTCIHRSQEAAGGDHP